MHWQFTIQYIMCEQIDTAVAKVKSAMYVCTYTLHTHNGTCLSSCWSHLQEKDVAVSTDDYGKDLATVQALQRKHEGFEVRMKQFDFL